MFGNKKNNLPPRPQPPLVKQILEDIRDARIGDFAFRLNAGESQTNTSDTESVYEKLQIYLHVKKSLNELSDTIKGQNQLLQSSDLEMKRIARDLRRQAQEALVKQ